MTTSNRQLWLLAVLAILATLLVVLRQPDGTIGAPSAPRPAPSSQASRAADAVASLRLDLLETPADEGGAPERNLFRFESRRSAAASASRPAPVTDVVADGPPPPVLPPPPPPIPLRYIGYVDQQGGVPRVAVLSDGRGNVFNGKEGDIIEGRYRVVRIGTESADLMYVDGRGRQTIRLSGQ